MSVHHYCFLRRQFGVDNSVLVHHYCLFQTIRDNSEDNSVSVHHYCFLHKDNSVSVHHYCFLHRQFGRQFGVDNSVSVHHYCLFQTIRCRQFGVSSSLLLLAETQFGVSSSLCFLHRQFGVSSSLLLPLHHGTIRCHSSLSGQFGVSSSLLLPLHQAGKLDSWEDFQDRQGQFGVGSPLGTIRCPAAHNAVGLAGESPAVGIDCLST